MSAAEVFQFDGARSHVAADVALAGNLAATAAELQYLLSLYDDPDGFESDFVPSMLRRAVTTIEAATARIDRPTARQHLVGARDRARVLMRNGSTAEIRTFARLEVLRLDRSLRGLAKGAA